MQVSTNQVRTYQLRNSGLWFKSMLKSDSAREWIEAAVHDGDDIFVVVGIHNMTDTKIIEAFDNAADTSAWFHLPIGEALATAKVVAPSGGAADAGVGVQNSHQEGETIRGGWRADLRGSISQGPRQVVLKSRHGQSIPGKGESLEGLLVSLRKPPRPG